MAKIRGVLCHKQLEMGKEEKYMVNIQRFHCDTYFLKHAVRGGREQGRKGSLGTPSSGNSFSQKIN